MYANKLGLKFIPKLSSDKTFVIDISGTNDVMQTNGGLPSASIHLERVGDMSVKRGIMILILLSQN